MEDIEIFFGNSALHDYEMGRIEINYSEGTVFFQFINSKQKRREYIIRQFVSVSFTKNEEWGMGKYVVSSEVSCSNGMWSIEIQLNSGDICSVMCRKQGKIEE